MVHLPVMVVASIFGFWLVSLQHRFETARWMARGDWDFVAASLDGSSWFRLPRALHWLTGNIGFHHVHHLNPHVPNYRLHAAHDALQALRPTRRSACASGSPRPGSRCGTRPPDGWCASATPGRWRRWTCPAPGCRATASSPEDTRRRWLRDACAPAGPVPAFLILLVVAYADIAYAQLRPRLRGPKGTGMLPANTSAYLWGAFGGAVIVAVVGFSWGGWTTAGTAQRNASTAAHDAVVAVLAPICVDRFQGQTDAAAPDRRSRQDQHLGARRRHREEWLRHHARRQVRRTQTWRAPARRSSPTRRHPRPERAPRLNPARGCGRGAHSRARDRNNAFRRKDLPRGPTTNPARTLQRRASRTVETGRQAAPGRQNQQSMARTMHAAASPGTLHTSTYRATLAIIGIYAALTLALLTVCRQPGPEMPGFNARLRRRRVRRRPRDLLPAADPVPPDPAGLGAGAGGCLPVLGADGRGLSAGLSRRGDGRALAGRLRRRSRGSTIAGSWVLRW